MIVVEEIARYRLVEPPFKIVDDNGRKVKQRLKRVNIVKWWHENRHAFPILAETAKKLFCVMVSSAPCERVWKAAARLIEKRRNRIADIHLERQVQLYENRHYLAPEVYQEEMAKLQRDVDLAESEAKEEAALIAAINKK